MDTISYKLIKTCKGWFKVGWLLWVVCLALNLQWLLYLLRNIAGE